jgi:hypothetical protein
MRISEIITESQELEEGWKSKVGAAALAGLGLLGAGQHASAQTQNYQNPPAATAQQNAETYKVDKIANMETEVIPKFKFGNAGGTIGAFTGSIPRTVGYLAALRDDDLLKLLPPQYEKALDKLADLALYNLKNNPSLLRDDYRSDEAKTAVKTAYKEANSLIKEQLPKQPSYQQVKQFADNAIMGTFEALQNSDIFSIQQLSPQAKIEAKINADFKEMLTDIKTMYEPDIIANGKLSEYGKKVVPMLIKTYTEYGKQQQSLKSPESIKQHAAYMQELKNIIEKYKPYLK